MERRRGEKGGLGVSAGFVSQHIPLWPFTFILLALPGFMLGAGRAGKSGRCRCRSGEPWEVLEDIVSLPRPHGSAYMLPE